MKRLGLSILLALIALVVAGGVWLSVSWQDAAAAPDFWEGEIVAFEETDAIAPPEKGLVLFTGSSSIRFWTSLTEDMEPLRVLNRGFGGAHMSHVVYNADRIIKPYAPRALVVYVGDNDIGSGKTPEVVEADFRELLAKVRETLPEIPVYYLTIKASRLRWDLWPEMQKANERIRAIAAADPLVRILDVSSPMVELGAGEAPPSELFKFDGLHLSEEGYALWTEIVRPRLLAELGAG
jgi:hypothetical protein